MEEKSAFEGRELEENNEDFLYALEQLRQQALAHTVVGPVRYSISFNPKTQIGAVNFSFTYKKK